ncbi:hypothetical protein DPMN_105641 [Dreissena polymorpha]|uniref:Uncharacterized protein n=1 Tax=Dreissena polymorpha TaxID=45954 RepID=A0A9D4K3J6_DREPO|nr:hypothetical protein DPMN_105641 [Dreissena polymorpha]
MPRNLPIARVVLEVVEKNIAQDAILMTLQIWGCFVPGISIYSQTIILRDINSR